MQRELQRRVSERDRIAQGVGALKGSMMSGHGQYAVPGVVVALVGIGFLAWAWRSRGRGKAAS
jgi:hypothetical protein